MTRRRVWRLGLVLAGVAAVAALVFLTGLYDVVGDKDRFVDAVHDAGVWGPTLYVALMTVLVAFGVPGIVFVVPAASLWPEPIAIIAFLIGGMAASTVRLIVVRSVGRDWVEARLPERYRRWDERLAASGFRTVVVLRLLFNLAAPVDWLLALSGITVRDFFLGTLVGRTPVAILCVIVGGNFFEWLSKASLAVLITGGLALLLTGSLLRRRAARRSAIAVGAFPATTGRRSRR